MVIETETTQMCNGFMECMANTDFVIGMVACAAAIGTVVIVGMLVWFEVSDFIENRRK